MLTFAEYLQRRPPTLLDPISMLNRLKINLDGEHEVEVLSMVKRWGKQAAAPALRPVGGAEPIPQPGKRPVKTAMKPAR